MSVEISPHVLANVVDIQKVHLLLHTQVLNKTPRFSSAIMFVRRYRLLLTQCIYVHVSVTKPTYPSFIVWFKTGSIKSLKVTGTAIMLCSMALPSKLCTALYGQSNVGSMCDCKRCRSMTCQFWWKFYQELAVTMVQVPEGTTLSTQGQYYVQYEEGLTG